MRIKLTKSNVCGHAHYTLSGNDGGHLFSFLPELGCCLNELKLANKKIFRSVDPTRMEEMIQQAYNGAQLFPFPNRLADGEYYWNEEKYTFDLNDKGRPNALHGILGNKRFQIKDYLGQGALTAKYEYRKDHLAYPFDLDIFNTFQLGRNFLEIVTRIKNVGKDEAPVAHGWHPYFNGVGGIDGCKICIPKSEELIVDNNLIPTGKNQKFDDFISIKKIDQAQFDSCYYGMHEAIELVNEHENYEIRISSKSYPYTQIFIPPSRDSIAIEPQTCAPNGFNNKLGLIVLEPNQSKKFSFRIDLKE